MFDLEKLERRILVFLLAALLVGAGVVVYKRLCPTGDLSIVHSGLPSPAVGRHAFIRSKKININNASVDQLMNMRGVGKVLSERIVEYRTKKGLFSSTEDIKKVPGIGEKLYAGIKDNISLE